MPDKIVEKKEVISDTKPNVGLSFSTCPESESAEFWARNPKQLKELIRLYNKELRRQG